MASVIRFVAGKLKPLVNAAESRAVPFARCTFLGFRFTRCQIRWRDEAGLQAESMRSRASLRVGRSRSLLHDDPANGAADSGGARSAGSSLAALLALLRCAAGLFIALLGDGGGRVGEALDLGKLETPAHGEEAQAEGQAGRDQQTGRQRQFAVR